MASGCPRSESTAHFDQTSVHTPCCSARRALIRPPRRIFSEYAGWRMRILGWMGFFLVVGAEYGVAILRWVEIHERGWRTA